MDEVLLLALERDLGVAVFLLLFSSIRAAVHVCAPVCSTLGWCHEQSSPIIYRSEYLEVPQR